MRYKTTVSALLAAWLLVVICSTAPACAAAGAGDIDSYLARCAERAHIPAMSVTIVDQENVLFSQGYGGCPDTGTPFVLGSVSKSFTAVCIMQLVEKGKVDLDAPVSAYLPDAAGGGQIAVRQLLNHTSGLGEHQTLANCRIIHEQGVHHYANVNYSLLGEIIEAVSGESYSDYLTGHVLQPLGLSHTAATLSQSMENGLIEGYTNFGGFPVKTAHRYPASKNAWITAPAGYLSSSTDDLGRYLQMYLNGGEDILSRQSIDAMFYGDTVYVDDRTPYWYGYGWLMVEGIFPEPVLRHSGLVETGTSCLFLLPESGRAIAITANMNDYFIANQMMDSIGWGLVSLLLGTAPGEPGGSAYVLGHFWMDLGMLAVWMAAIVPLCLLPQYTRRPRRGRLRPAAVRLVLLHVLLPVLLLSLVPAVFATPLWVARAFVPDVYLTVTVPSALLFTGGILKGAILYRQRRRGGTIV